MWLKLRWARFFTLAGWNWKLSPRPGFDFQVTFPCNHSECHGSHTLIVRVVDKCYEALAHKHSETFAWAYNEPNPALFGDGPENTYWEMCHGAGGGSEQVDEWMTSPRADVNRLWERAACD
jgi:hypothetical protein